MAKTRNCATAAVLENPPNGGKGWFVMKLSDFVSESHINGALIRAVVRQIGGWSEFQEHAPDVVNHGAAAGFSGFIYYAETCRFTARNRRAIADLAEAMAADLGEPSAVALVSGFNCIRGNGITEGEISRALYGRPRPDDDSTAENALAWFALEEVCRSFVDLAD